MARWIPDQSSKCVQKTLSEKTTFRITGDQRQFDEMEAASGAPHEYLVQVSFGEETADIELEDKEFYQNLKVGDIVVGTRGSRGGVVRITKR